VNGAWVAETVIGSAITWAVFTGMAALWAKRKLLPKWHTHQANQKAILANQETILGDRFERPTA
jgi:hypothetical protein